MQMKYLRIWDKMSFSIRMGIPYEYMGMGSHTCMGRYAHMGQNINTACVYTRVCGSLHVGITYACIVQVVGFLYRVKRWT